MRLRRPRAGPTRVRDGQPHHFPIIQNDLCLRPAPSPLLAAIRNELGWAWGASAAAGRPADSAVEVETSVQELFGTGHINGRVLACSMAASQGNS